MLNRPFKEPFKIDGKFGERRSYGLHSGIDENGIDGGNTDCGYKLYPITKGEVVHTSTSNSGYGNIVVYRIDGPWGQRWVRYAHCREILVRSGSVTPETVIATLGTSGNSSACHLHWDVIKKPMNNWRTYARDKAILDEYFEDPTAFFNMWKDAKEQEEMPKWLDTLLRENNQDPEGNWEPWFREVLGKAKDFDTKYQEVLKSWEGAESRAADASDHNAELVKNKAKLEGGLQTAKDSLAECRDEKSEAVYQNDLAQARADKFEEENEELIEKNENLRQRVTELSRNVASNLSFWEFLKIKLGR